MPHALETRVADVDARTIEPLGEEVGVTQQQVVSAHLQVGRGQSVEIGPQHRELGVERIGVPAVELTTVDRPVAAQSDVAAAVEAHRGPRAGQVEPAVQQHQPRGHRLTGIAEPRRERHGKAGPR